MAIVFQMGLEDLTESANCVKEQLLFALERDGLLKKPAAELAEDYAVVLSKEGWLGKLFLKIKGQPIDPNNVRVTVVKAV